MNKKSGFTVATMTRKTDLSRSAIYKAEKAGRLFRGPDGYFNPEHPVNAQFLKDHKKKEAVNSFNEQLSKGKETENGKILVKAVSTVLEAYIDADQIQEVKARIAKVYKANGGT